MNEFSKHYNLYLNALSEDILDTLDTILGVDNYSVSKSMIRMPAYLGSTDEFFWVVVTILTAKTTEQRHLLLELALCEYTRYELNL